MHYKKNINRLIGIGLVCFLLLVAILWWLLPGIDHSEARGWLFLYSIPLLFGVLGVLLGRYGSEDLIKGYASTNKGLELEQAYLQNTLEQTVIAVPLVFGFIALSPASLAKIIPIHALLFLIGRFAFWLGYKLSPENRIPGFIITSYANIGLLLGCIYLFIVG